MIPSPHSRMVVAGKPWALFTSGVLSLHLTALLGYVLLSIVLTWPLAAHWNSAYVAYLEEAGHNAWNIWWVREALARPTDPFWSDMLFFPEGVQLYVQTFNILGSLLTMPIALTMGVTAAHNTLVLAAFALTGYGAFVLARHMVGGFAVPFLCGAIFTAGPYHLMQFEINHLNILSIQWLPLYLWALLRLDEQPTPRNVLPAALFFLLNGLTDWYWALICALITAIWWMSGLLRREDRLRRLGVYLLTGGLIGLGLLPLLLRILSLRAVLPTTDLSADTVWREYIRGFSLDALGLVLPNMLHPLWGAQIRPTLESALSPVYSPSGWYIAAGWTLLLCALIGVWTYWRSHWRVLALGGIAWLFSLGPSLRILSYDTGLPMPYTLLESFELLSVARKPSHFAYISLLSILVFAALGLQRLHIALPPPRRNLLLAGVAGLALFELWPPIPYPLHPIEQPAIVADIRERPGIVADLPLERTETSRALRHQMIHGQPIVGGYVSRMPRYASLDYDPIIFQIGRMRPWSERDIFPVDHEAMAAMHCATPVRHVLVLRSEANSTMLAGIEQVLTAINGAPLPPLASDERFLHYELPLHSDRCRPYLFPGAGWYAVEQADSRVWRWAGADNEIWLVNPGDEHVSAILHLRAEAYQPSVQAELWDDQRQLAVWNVTGTPRNYAVPITLPPGRSQLRLRAATAYDSVSDRDLSISVQQLQLTPASQ